MDDILDKLAKGDELHREARAEILRHRNSSLDFKKLAVAAYGVVTFATQHPDGISDGYTVPREQFIDLTAALARVGVSH